MNLQSRRDRVIKLAQAVVNEFRAENTPFMAGSIAYHAFVSLLPLLILVLAVISTIGDRSLEEAFITFAGAVLTPDTGGVLKRQLEAAGASTGVSLFGLGVLVWGTFRIFRGLDQAFSDIYETESRNSIVDQFTDGVVVLVTFGIALLAGWWINGALATLGDGVFVTGFRWIVLTGGLALTFLPMYYIFPDADVTVSEVVPGVVVVAIGLTAFESLFRLYTQYKSPESGIVAGVLVLLTWLYFSGVIILLGAVINAVLSNRSEDVDVFPVFGGVDPIDQASAEQEQLIARLHELETAIDDADSVTVLAGETKVTLPPPRVTTSTKLDMGRMNSEVRNGDRSIRLDFRWGPQSVPNERRTSES